MLEAIVNPINTEKGPWKMFFVGLIYATASLLLVHIFFSGDSVLSNYLGLIVVTFCVMFSLPYMYFMIKMEEEEDETAEGFLAVWKVHSDVIYGFMWLFLGFIIAFSFFYILIGNSDLFNAQVETYCMINSPGGIEECVAEYELTQKISATGGATKFGRFFSIPKRNH